MQRIYKKIGILKLESKQSINLLFFWFSAALVSVSQRWPTKQQGAAASQRRERADVAAACVGARRGGLLWREWRPARGRLWRERWPARASAATGADLHDSDQRGDKVIQVGYGFSSATPSQPFHHQLFCTRSRRKSKLAHGISLRHGHGSPNRR